MTSPMRPSECIDPPGECQLCGDVAVLGRVLEIDALARTAVVQLAEGERTAVAIDLVDAEVGDELLIHLGFAIQRVEVA